MKALTLIFAVSLTANLTVFAQGTLTVQNSATTLIQDILPPNGAIVPTPLSDGAKFQLLYVPETGAFANTPPVGLFGGSFSMGPWELAGTTFIEAAPGRIVAGTRTTGNDVTGGANVWLEIVGWNGGAPDFLTAISGGTAIVIANSAVWSNLTGAPNGNPPTNPQLLALGLNGFDGMSFDYNGPEPSSMVLGGVGAAIIWAYRPGKR